MALIASNIFPSISRHSTAARRAAELANALAAYAMTRVFAAAGVTTAGTAAKAKTANTVTFTVAGAWQTAVTATDNLFVLGGTTAATVVGKSSFQKYVFVWDSTGASNALVYEGTQSTVSAATVSWKNISNLSVYAPVLTLLNAGLAIVGVATVATDASHTFTPGTTAFNGTGITTTYIDGLDQSLLPLNADVRGTLLGLGG